MKTTVLSTLALLLAACAADPPTSPTGPASSAGNDPASRLERNERALAIGADPTVAKVTAEGVASDPTATDDERDEAALQKSRALELAGDREGAIRAVEALLASRGDEHTSQALDRAANKQLDRLVSPNGDAKFPKLEDEPTVAPIAHALAAYFPLRAGNEADVQIAMIGGSNATNERLGTFEIAGAIKADHASACALCDDDLAVHTGRWRSSGPSSFPRMGKSFERALAVVYVDLAENRLPARYEGSLPLPVADVEARLARGEGLIAVRERDGAPPVILLAAPRTAQLDEVEEAFAAMKALPKEPVVVAVKSPLAAREIQAVVRTARKAMKACYERTLEASPRAAGKVTFAFGIDGGGAVVNLRTETDFADADLQACLAGTVSGLHFPATGGASLTTVRYPMAFSPDAPAN